MGVKIQKRLQVLSLIERSKEDFKKELEKTITPEVIKTLEAGNNPIKAGKPVKYSQSYIDQIEGKLRFFTANGNVIAVKPDNIESSTISFNKKTGKAKKTGINQDNTFAKGMGVGKLKSPVNLKLTGELHNSIDTRPTKDGVEVYFKDEKAQWHNDGVKENNLPARRLLPNKSGEEFNANIFKRILAALQAAIKKNIK